MAERLVELLVAREADEQHADLLPAPVVALRGDLQRAGQVLAVGQPGDPVVPRLVVVDDRLAAAELDRHQRDAEQRDEPEVVVRRHQDHRDERGQHHGPPCVQPEVRAHRVQRPDPACERGRRARQRGVEDEEQHRGGDQRGDVLGLEVLQPALVREVARQEVEQGAGRRPADRVLGDVEDQPLERPPADPVGERERDRVDEDDGRDPVGEQQRERERGRERDLAAVVGKLDGEQLGDEDRDREHHQQRVGVVDDVGGAGHGDDGQQRHADHRDGDDERAMGRSRHGERSPRRDLDAATTSWVPRARPRARRAPCPSAGCGGSRTSSPPPHLCLDADHCARVIGSDRAGLKEAAKRE